MIRIQTAAVRGTSSSLWTAGLNTRTSFNDNYNGWNRSATDSESNVPLMFYFAGDENGKDVVDKRNFIVPAIIPAGTLRNWHLGLVLKNINDRVRSGAGQ